MITIKIAVTKIDKALLYKGSKGTYLNVTLKDNKDGPDQYGNDGFVTQDVSAEARKAGERGPIIGNWKTIGQKPAAKPAAQKRPPVDHDLDSPDEESVPF